MLDRLIMLEREDNNDVVPMSPILLKTRLSDKVVKLVRLASGDKRENP